MIATYSMRRALTNEIIIGEVRSYITITTLSRAANARISAHDTMPGHSFSSCVLAACMTGNPLKEFAFGSPVCSLVGPAKSTEASHPCSK
jgi:hypothetical protein